ncbi:peroxiredoxin family protein [Thermodesulfobacteriota bacterium]
MKKAGIACGIACGIALAALLWRPGVLPATAGKVIGKGDPVPRIAIDQKHLSSNDLGYLGISTTETIFRFFKQNDISLDNINGDVIVLEFLNTHCVTCQAQSHIMNQVYQIIAETGDLQKRIKLLGIAAGNSGNEVKRFRKRRKVPFPIMPDPDFEAYDAMGPPGGTPYTVLIRNRNNRLVVSYAHRGLSDSTEHLCNKIRHALSYGDIRPGQTDADRLTPKWKNERQLVLDLTRGEVLDLIKRSMLDGDTPSGSPQLTDPERLRLPQHGEIYKAQKILGGEKTTLFSKIISRKPVCDICHGVHFVITFNQSGHITNFTPIHLTKAANIKWGPVDNNHTRARLIGKPLSSTFTFNPQVDAVSTATMTSALIFNSVNRLKEVYTELQQQGRLTQ